MRKCKGKCLVNGRFEEFDIGLFHGWGCNYEEFESGPGNCTIAIVELLDGRVVEALPRDICFMDSFSGVIDKC